MGREFLHVFEEWAIHYDRTVSGETDEYKNVFINYEEILEEVARKSNGCVLEFGTGTGNLTEKLVAKGLNVIAIEPSIPMMNIAKGKIQNQLVTFCEGDFLHYPKVEAIDTIVSTYAFHHLTDDEKRTAVKEYGNLLPIGGKIVFADTMFENEEAYKQTIHDAEIIGFSKLANDLKTEYYPMKSYIEQILVNNGFSVQFNRCNHFVWLFEATKQ